MNKLISYRYITDYHTLSHEAESLNKETAIGVDLESDSLFHYKEKVCLLQISTVKKNLLIDTLAVKDLAPLAPVFSNCNIRKILHGADYDIRSLHRDFGIEICSLFDTQLAARILGVGETGLANLLKDHFDIELEKKYQKKDWSKRPLSDEMLSYGVYDTCFLIPLGRILEKHLIEKGRYSWFEEECRLLTGVRFNHAGKEPLYCRFKGAGKLAPRNLAILEALLKLREELATVKDRPPFKVLNNDQVLDIALGMPTTINDLKTLTHGQINNIGKKILSKIKEILNTPEKNLPIYPKNETRNMATEFNREIKLLKNWRNRTANKLDIEPSLLCTNAQIQSLVEARPEDISMLNKLDILKKWQADLYGDELCTMFRKMSCS